MFQIVNKQILAQGVKRLDVSAKLIARSVHPGQFVLVIPEEGGARIPLTVVESDIRRGTISLIIKEEGKTTRQLGALPINDYIFSIMGPLGNPASIRKFGVVVCVATGAATAQILPICRAYKNAGNKVIGIIGADSRKSLFLDTQMRLACHKLFITTKDGSFERRGIVTDLIKEIVDKESVQLVYAIGDIKTLKSICQLTISKSIPSRVQLNPYMFCGVGTCGSCRVKIGEHFVLSCQDGPEFDGHKVDFKHFEQRMKSYGQSKQKTALYHDIPEDRDSNFLKKIFKDLEKKFFNIF